MSVLVHLPNRRHIEGFRPKQLREEDILQILEMLFVMLIFQFLSLVMLCNVVKNAFNFDMVKFAGFQLRKSNFMVPTFLFFYMLLVLCVNLDHSGVDVSLKFSWINEA